jgi:hypothetical protein
LRKRLKRGAVSFRLSNGAEGAACGCLRFPPSDFRKKERKNVKLDGREFEGLTQSLTARQNDYITVNLRLSGASEILATFEQTDSPETRAAKAESCVNRILESGRKYKIIAGMLTEQGKKWTREQADKNAEIFGDLRDTDEQRTMNSELLAMIVGFFRFGEVSSPTSPTSSSQSEKAPESSNEVVLTTANSGT